MKKIGLFLASVKQEMKKVRWPNKKEMLKYSAATLMFVIFFAAFFSATDFVITSIKMLVK